MIDQPRGDIRLKMLVNDTRNMGKRPYVIDDARFVFEVDHLREGGLAY